MGLGRTEQQITWSAANSLVLSSTAMSSPSDEFTIDSTVVAISMSARATNGGTPASGDVVNIYIKWSNGDLDAGGGANDYDSDEHAMWLMQLDTYPTNTPGENPAAKTFPLDPNMGKAFKVIIQDPGWASGRNITFAARCTLRTAT